MLDLRDDRGIGPVEKITDRENASREFRLDQERTGDLIIANRAGYGWSEETTADLAIFSTPLTTGYKQAVIAENQKGMWTPFLIMGPGIRKAHFLGEKPIEAIDQHPTLLKCLGVPQPNWVQGRVVREAFVQP